MHVAKLAFCLLPDTRSTAYVTANFRVGFDSTVSLEIAGLMLSEHQPV